MLPVEVSNSTCGVVGKKISLNGQTTPQVVIHHHHHHQLTYVIDMGNRGIDLCVGNVIYIPRLSSPLVAFHILYTRVCVTSLSL